MNENGKLKLPSKLDWGLLNRFNVVVNSPSFIEAASRIGTSQGALLKQLTTLEENLNLKLFIRVNKNRINELTSAGKNLAAITARMNNLVSKQIIDRIDEIESLVHRTSFKIITTAGLSTTLLSPIISDFLNEHQNIRLELITPIVPPKLSVNQLIVRNDFISQPRLKLVNLLNINSSFYASTDYISKYGEPLSYNDFVKHKILSIKYFHRTNTDMYAYNQDSFIHLEPFIGSDYISFLIEMAINGHGIIEIPNIHPATKKLVKLSSLKTVNVDIKLGYLDVADQDKIIYSFINYLLERCKQC